MTILFLVNHEVVIYNFRREMVEQFIVDGHDVHICSPSGEKIDLLIKKGAIFHEINIDRHGMNPIEELRIISYYKRLMKEIKPDICFGFTIKPNVYGGIVSSRLGIPFVANITGLGTSIHGGGISRIISSVMYKIALKKVQTVFFQNNQDKDVFLKKGIVSGEYEVLPGSGVNLYQHCYEKYPQEEKEIVFSTIGRIMKDKGIDELISAAKIVKGQGYRARFRIIGFFDDEYEDIIKSAVQKGYVEYISQKNNIHPYIKESHAIIQPSHHEGMSNVLLESEATGRPVIASNIHGCIEAFDEWVSGLSFEVKSAQSLADTLICFMKLPHEKKERMGIEARKKVEQEFDRNIVVNRYRNQIERVKERINEEL